MARYSVSIRTAAGSSTLPIISIYSIAAVGGYLREVGLFNTTTTDVALRLMRLTTAGTQGAGQTESKYNPDAPTASMTTFTTHTVAPTLSDELYRATLGAAIGAGVIWTFGDVGLRIPVGTGNGIGVVPVATGQVVDAYMVWDE
jgi:hypothetical protein